MVSGQYTRSIAYVCPAECTPWLGTLSAGLLIAIQRPRTGTSTVVGSHLTPPPGMNVVARLRRISTVPNQDAHSRR